MAATPKDNLKRLSTSNKDNLKINSSSTASSQNSSSGGSSCSDSPNSSSPTTMVPRSTPPLSSSLFPSLSLSGGGSSSSNNDHHNHNVPLDFQQRVKFQQRRRGNHQQEEQRQQQNNDCKNSNQRGSPKEKKQKGVPAKKHRSFLQCITTKRALFTILHLGLCYLLFTLVYPQATISTVSFRSSPKIEAPKNNNNIIHHPIPIDKKTAATIAGLSKKANIRTANSDSINNSVVSHQSNQIQRQFARGNQQEVQKYEEKVSAGISASNESENTADALETATTAAKSSPLLLSNEFDSSQQQAEPKTASQDFLVVLQDGSLYCVTAAGKVRWSKHGILRPPPPASSPGVFVVEGTDFSPSRAKTRRLFLGDDGEILYRGDDGGLIVSVAFIK